MTRNLSSTTLSSPSRRMCSFPCSRHCSIPHLRPALHPRRAYGGSFWRFSLAWAREREQERESFGRGKSGGERERWKGIKDNISGECPGLGVLVFEWEWRGPEEGEARHRSRARSHSRSLLVVLGTTRPFSGTHHHCHRV